MLCMTVVVRVRDARMVNSTRGYASLPTQVTRNKREVYFFPNTIREPALPETSVSELGTESLELRQNEAKGLELNDSQSTPDGYVTFVVQEGAANLPIVPHETHLVNDNHGCVQSAVSVLAPIAAASP